MRTTTDTIVTLRTTATAGRAGVAIAACLLASCAGMETLVSEPRVSLRQVELTELDFSGQTFRLDFDVTNPNPFPLPVEAVDYGVRLDGQRFASGSADAAFTVPASGDSGFAISVELDLLDTAPALLFLVRESAYREIPYQLEGKFEVGVPFAKPLRFEDSGTIRLVAASH